MGSSFFIFEVSFPICLITKNITKAIIKKLTILWINIPYLTSAPPTVIDRDSKLIPPISIPIRGIIILSTREVTMAPKAAPITTPTAISITLPRAINAAMFVSGDSYDCLRAWRSLDLEYFNKNIEISNKNFKNLDLIEIIKNRLNEITKKITDIGVSPQPLFDHVDKLICEDKIRNSQIDFGLCTVNISDFKTMFIGACE